MTGQHAEYDRPVPEWGSLDGGLVRRRHLNQMRRLRSFPLKARTAEHRAALRRLEGDRRLHAALRAVCPRLGTYTSLARRSLRLALLAALGVVRELFFVKKQLFACGKNKLVAAVLTRQNAIRVFHGRLSVGKE